MRRSGRVKPRKFFKFHGDSRDGTGPDWVLVNSDRLQADGTVGLDVAGTKTWPDGYLVLPRGPWRFPDYLEPPRLVVAKGV